MKDISLHILDIAQNSIKAKATCVEIKMEEQNGSLLKITIADNGTGMSKDFLEKVTDPYTTSRTTRKVGLGIPLFKQNAERTGGKFIIESTMGKGTLITATFNTQHLDCLPLGDMPGVMSLLINANPDIDFKYEHKVNDKTYLFDTIEVKEILGDTPINNFEIQQFIKEMIKENLTEIYSKF